jgi:chromosome segregation ATPase
LAIKFGTKMAVNCREHPIRTNPEMTKNIDNNSNAGEKSARQRKTSARTTRKDKGIVPLADFKEIVDVPAIRSVSSRQAEDEWQGKIRELENRLKEQEAIVARRDAELGAAEADAAALAVLQKQLRAKDDLLREKEIATKAEEQNISSQIQSLQEQLKTQEQLLASREAELESLRELLNTETEETRRRREARSRSSAETARLIEEQREAKLALAKVEMEEWHIIGRRNAWKRAFRALQKLFEKPRRNHEDERLKEQTP